jgi:hypothetical protein
MRWWVALLFLAAACSVAWFGSVLGFWLYDVIASFYQRVTAWFDRRHTSTLMTAEERQGKRERFLKLVAGIDCKKEI